MGPVTTIPLSRRVDDSCSDSVFVQKKKGIRQRGRVVRGWVGRKRGTDWLAVSWGACLPAGKGHGTERG